MQVARQELLRQIRESHGKIMTVLFVKRSDGSIRTMNCRTEVKKHLKGGESTIRPHHRLISVYDLQSKAYRSIPEEGVFEVRIRGKAYRLNQPNVEEAIQTAVY